MVNIAVNSADLKFREYVQKCQINLVSTLATSCQEIYTISYIWTIVAFEKHKSSSIMFIVIPPLKMCLCVLGSVLCCLLRFPHKNNVQFVWIYSCLLEGACVYLRYSCLFAHSRVQRILCCVSALIIFVLCTLCCQFLWIFLFWFPLRYFLTIKPKSYTSRILRITEMFHKEF